MGYRIKNIVINPWNLFHCPPYNIQQLICNRLLATLIILLRQILNQFICIVRATCIANVRAACSDALESTAAVKIFWLNTVGISWRSILPRSVR